MKKMVTSPQSMVDETLRTNTAAPTTSSTNLGHPPTNMNNNIGHSSTTMKLVSHPNLRHHRLWWSMGDPPPSSSLSSPSSCQCQCHSQCCHRQHPQQDRHHPHNRHRVLSARRNHQQQLNTFILLIAISVLSCFVVTIDYRFSQNYIQMIAPTMKSHGGETLLSSPLHDKTLQWDDTQFPHTWLAYEKQQHELSSMHNTTGTSAIQTVIPKPPYMIVLTEYGWNHVDQKLGLTFARSIRSTEFIQSIVNHPYFHPTAYHEIMTLRNRTVDLNLTYYVFLDIETCYETNYPYYGKSYSGNCDRNGHRDYYTYTYIKYRHPPTAACYNFDHPHCHYIATEIQQNPIFTAATMSSSSSSSSLSSNTTGSRLEAAAVKSSNNIKTNSKLVVFDCRGNGQSALFRKSRVGNSTSLALVSLSSTAQQLNLQTDQGLSPPSIQIVPYKQHQHTTLSPSSVSQYDQEINCNCSSYLENIMPRRKYLLSFSGDYKRHPIRQELAKLDTARTTILSRDTAASTTTPARQEQEQQPLVLITDSKDLHQNTNGLTYSGLLLSSQYVAVPRGDNLFSYRFSEVLSSGAIPVLIHNSEWILPFRPEIVSWDRCVIRITADQINNTVPILQNISDYEQCQRRQYCYHVYETYMMNSTATIQGIFDGLQALVHAMQ